jgi:long-chain acyl-CoA synthetase
MTKTICHFLREARNNRSSMPALRFKKQREWHNLSWQDLYLQSENISASLIQLGVKKSDRVVILSNTRPEWVMLDMGIMGIGAITVPIYQSSVTEEIQFIIENCQPTVVFLENALQVKKWLSLETSLTASKKVICIEPYSELPDDLFSWEEFLDEGADQLNSNKAFLSDHIEQLSVEDIATILYTSGTTGTPKGVVLTHTQIVSEVVEAFDLFDITEDDCSLTFLPYAHVLGRIEAWGSIYRGFTLAFAESIERIRFNLVEVKPTILVAVPRIFEKLYVAITTQVEANPLQSKVFGWALSVGKKVSDAQIQKKNITFVTLLQLQLAKKLVFNNLAEKLGGRLRFAISGGAPLDSDLAHFFHSAGLLLLEGYGLTETTAAVCVNTPLNYKFGTVGRPIGDVQIKIAEDGEVLVKSKKVMKEYYKNPEATKSVFVEGYFATGDIGEITKDGYLKITDRKKDLIKTANGKYVAPQKIEGLLKVNRFISHSLIHGDKRKYIVALVTLNEPEVLAFAQAQNVSYQNFASLSQNPLIHNEVKKIIAAVNSQLASHESIKNFAILPKDFTIEDGELTPSLKVKRKFCDQKYQKTIETLYL